MEKILTASLIEDNGTQRFYKLSHPILKGYIPLVGKQTDISADLLASKERDFKEEYKHECPEACEIICISDAHTHSERLVFVGMEYLYNGKKILGRTKVQIEGCHTMSIHGGDKRSMKPDAVYLRRLASLNGFYFSQKPINETDPITQSTEREANNAS